MGFRVNVKTSGAPIGPVRETIIEDVLHEAALHALQLTFPNVPVYTGMSRGAFRAIGRLVQLEIPIQPVGSRPGQSPESGEAASTFFIEVDGGTFRIVFDTTVWQLLNLPFGVEAFNTFRSNARDYIRRELPPRIKRFVEFEIRTRLTKGLTSG